MRLSDWLALGLLLSLSFGASASPPWHLEIRQGDITIHSRRLNDGVWEFHARLDNIQAPPRAFMYLLMDTATHPLWLRNVGHTSILERPGEGQLLVRTLFDMPWPYHTRELINLSHYWQSPDSCVVYLEATAMPDAIPPTPDMVRMTRAHALWRMIPHANGRMTLSYQGYADPSGNVPQWLAKGVQQTELRYSLQQLSLLLPQPKYQQTHYAGLDDACRPARQ